MQVTSNFGAHEYLRLWRDEHENVMEQRFGPCFAANQHLNLNAVDLIITYHSVVRSRKDTTFLEDFFEKTVDRFNDAIYCIILYLLELIFYVSAMPCYHVVDFLCSLFPISARSLGS